MYNIHQYNALVQSQQKVRENQQKYAKYLLKHEGNDLVRQIIRKRRAQKSRKKHSSSFMKYLCYLFSNMIVLSILYLRMITLLGGGRIANIEILRIIRNFFPSRVSDINLIIRWTNTLMSDNANRSMNCQLRKNTQSSPMLSLKSKGAEV